VHDHCNDLHRRLAAVPTDSHFDLLRQHGSRSVDSRFRNVFGFSQLVCQPDRLRVHVETFPQLSCPGKANIYLPHFSLAPIILAFNKLNSDYLLSLLYVIIHCHR